MGVKGYKAFNKGMICRGKQYEENATYEENGNEICEAGVMHFCENPFDVLNYYPLVDENGDISDFAGVEAVGDIYKREDKIATNKLHIGAKLGLKGFIKACVDFTIEKVRVESGKDNEADSSGDSAKIGSSGDYAKIGSSGYSAQIGSSGYSAQISQPQELDGMTAWGLVSKALRNGTYGAVEEFNKLPPLVRQAVGMPDNLKNWATSDYQTIETVIQSNFLRTYETVVKRAKEINRMPDNIKSLIEKTNVNSYKAQIEQKFQRDINTLQIKENALIGQNTNAEEYIEAPREVQDRIDRMRG